MKGRLHGAAPLLSAAESAYYRGRQVTGLLILGGLLLGAALLRANWGDLFPVGWWR